MRDVVGSFVLLWPILLACAAGPMALAGSAGENSDGIYLILTLDRVQAEQDLKPLGVRQIGFDEAPLAFLGAASPSATTAARAAGFVLLPAQVLASLCVSNNRETSDDSGHR
jgi:hypothetical protein